MKKTVIALSMGAVLAAGASLTSCGNAKVEIESSEPMTFLSSQSEVAKKEIQKPEDLHTYALSELVENMQNTYAHVAFDKELVTTQKNLMAGNKAIEELYLDHNIEMLNTAAFKNCTNLKNVYCEEVVNIVGDEAFMGCTSLQEYVGNTATLGKDAFNGCNSLERVILLERGWKVRERALANCASLKTVLFPVTLEDIEEGAFEGTTSIEEIAMPYNTAKYMLKFCAGNSIKKLFVLTKKPFPFSGEGFDKSQCTLYVPDDYMEDFKNDASWSGFAEVKPLSESDYYKDDCSFK